MPSILVNTHEEIGEFNESFKPCYKWNAFNTGYIETTKKLEIEGVLNLVINGMPSILNIARENGQLAI